VDVSLVSPVDGETWVETSAVLGNGEGAVAVVDSSGNPMGLDKSMRLSHLFGQRDDADMEPLLDALEEVLEALEKAGVRPFVAYGTLLGAVRDGDFIGHDSDADIGYVSPHASPADVVRESFDLQRSLQAMGYTVQRYSGLGLKVIVQERDGSRGLDVFGGFQRDGRLYLMGEVGHPFRDEWLYPRTTATLAGRSVPVPAQPEHLLEAMYGEGWRVPDPAYKFTTPVSTVRRLNGWFRGTRIGLDTRWSRRAAGAEEVARRQSPFVTWAHERTPGTTTYVDVGCGAGFDAVWLAQRGASVWGLDYFPPDIRKGRRLARRRSVEATFELFNLLELRAVMEAAARLAREPGPRVVLAHHTLEATDRWGRENFLRLARAVTRDTGRTVVQAYVAPTPHSAALGLRPLREAAFAATVARSRGVIEHVEHLSEAETGVSGGTSEKSIVRMVMTWSR